MGLKFYVKIPYWTAEHGQIIDRGFDYIEFDSKANAENYIKLLIPKMQREAEIVNSVDSLGEHNRIVGGGL